MIQAFAGELAALHRLCWTALMAALMAVGALFHLHIGPVPVTMQDMFVALAGLVLGPRHGLYAVGLYVLAGCAGLPVFSGGRAGLGHLIGPTGGYLAGFFILAFCAGLGGGAGRRLPDGGFCCSPPPANDRKAALLPWTALAAAFVWTLCGWVLLYAAGTAWLMRAMNFSPAQALSVGVLPFLPAAAVKIPLCALLWRALWNRGLLPR